MLLYFSTALAEQTSLDIANHVEDVVLLQADVRGNLARGLDSLCDDRLRWSARDYTISLTNGEENQAISSRERRDADESSEVWTFMRYQNGKWLLSRFSNK